MNKGDRQYFTIGAGLRYNVFGLDFSYLVPVKRNNPLQNTMQFTLLFNFDKAENKEEGKQEFKIELSRFLSFQFENYYAYKFRI